MNKKGIAASKGYAIGKVFLKVNEEITITDAKIEDVQSEKELLNKALESSKKQLKNIKEKAVLEFTEQVTELSKQGVSDDCYNNLKSFFSDKQISEIIILLGQINFWNRINVSTKQVYKSNS